MCGIAGIFAYARGGPIDRGELLRIRDKMATRGPDGAGIWASDDATIGLAHRRLAIIDLSDAGAQPMSTRDGRLTITFNGEIYNYRALRRELEAKGVSFHSSSDTEVLLHLYAERGRDMVHALRGMYAFAIWDAREQGLFLARDAFGIKPLYYSEDRGTFRFASQVKALVAGGAVNTAADPAGLCGFYVWGFVPEPFTTFRAIRALPAGATMWVSRERLEDPRPFFRLNEELAAAAEMPTLDAAAKRDLLRDALHDSLAHHLIADVEVGIFLSAGLDSTTLAAMAAESSDIELRGLTLGFHEYRDTLNDETQLAQLVARRYGLGHRAVFISKSDFDRDLGGFLDAMDQPTTDGVNTYFVSKAAAESGMKVALSGLGGDELFGGYPSFRHVPMIRKYLRFGARIGAGVRRAAAPAMSWVTSPKYASLFEYAGSDAEAYLLRRALFMPWELEQLMDPKTAQEGWSELGTLPALQASMSGVKGSRARIMALEMQWYMRSQLLRDSDWAGMAHSLEIRVPLVDHVLLRRIAPMLVSASPPQKREFASTPATPLPAAVLERSKTGFIVPVREWSLQSRGRASRGLRGWARQVLRTPGGKRVLSLVTDAYGGHGGIALFNRDLATAVSNMQEVGDIVVIPRLIPHEPEALPPKVEHVTGGVGGKGRYAGTVVRELAKRRRIDLVCCGHINLLPLAALAKWISGAPLALCIYGIDAWRPPRNPLARLVLPYTDVVICISEVTAARFVRWSRFDRERTRILPVAVHLEWYEPRPKSVELLRRYGLEGKVVITTLGRLVSEERYKGFDEVLDVLPGLLQREPRLAYLIVGDGSDRKRLEKRAATLGLVDHVVFTGHVPEREKADHIRLADAFVMASRGEGFGFVILEALACGIPVVGSKRDGTREALRHGMLGEVVDPENPRELSDAILRAIARPTREVHEGLRHFDFPNFCARAAGILSPLLGASTVASHGASFAQAAQAYPDCGVRRIYDDSAP